LLDDWQMVDVTVIPIEDHFEWGIQPTMKILWERDSALSQLTRKAVSYRQVSEDQRAKLISHYGGLFYVYSASGLRALRGGDTWPGIYDVERARSCLFALLRLEHRDYPPFLRKPEKDIGSVLTPPISQLLKIYRITTEQRDIAATLLLLI